MDQWELALLIGAGLTAVISISDRRALLWLALGAADFAITTTYARHAIPLMPAAFVTGMIDSSVALLLITFAQRRWERALGYIFQGMVLVSFVRLTGLLADHFVYVVTLELANWAALLVIGGSAIARLVDAFLARSARGGTFARGFHRLGAMARGPRQGAPFWSPASARRPR